MAAWPNSPRRPTTGRWASSSTSCSTGALPSGTECPLDYALKRHAPCPPDRTCGSSFTFTRSPSSRAFPEAPFNAYCVSALKLVVFGEALSRVDAHTSPSLPDPRQGTQHRGHLPRHPHARARVSRVCEQGGHGGAAAHPGPAAPQAGVPPGRSGRGGRGPQARRPAHRARQSGRCSTSS